MQVLAELAAPAVQRAVRLLAHALVPFLQRTVAPAVEQLTQVTERAEDIVRRSGIREQLARASELAGPAIVALDRLRHEGFPNWPSPFAVHIALLAEQDGLPVAWVPRAELLTKWSLAPDLATRMDLLLEHADQVVDDCNTALNEVLDPELAGPRDLLRQAVMCVRDQPAPAQALALPAAVTLSAELVGTGRHLYRLTSALAPLTRPLYLSEMGQLRSTLTLLAVRPVLERFDPDKGDPVPTRANRHAVAHAVHPGQYTLPNALLSVLLAVSVLRQMQADRDLVDALDEASAPTTAHARRPGRSMSQPATQ